MYRLFVQVSPGADPMAAQEGWNKHLDSPLEGCGEAVRCAAMQELTERVEQLTQLVERMEAATQRSGNQHEL